MTQYIDDNPVERAQEITDTCREMLRLAEFVQEGLAHQTLVEALYMAMKELQAGCTIEEALRTGRLEWFK